MTHATSVIDNFGRLNKIRVKSKMSRNEKKGHGGKHTRPKKWSGACRPAGQATTTLQRNAFLWRADGGPTLNNGLVAL